MSKSVEIAIVGKYTTQADTYTSIIKALEHAGLESNRKVVIKFVDSSSLEKDFGNEDPVTYHQAWQIVCKAELVFQIIYLFLPFLFKNKCSQYSFPPRD